MRLSSIVLVLATGCGFQGHGMLVDAAAIDGAVIDDLPPPDVADAPPDGTDGPMPIGGWKKVFTVHGSQVAGPLTDFPVLIDLVDDDLARAIDGTDLYFTTNAGASLAFERELFDKAARRLVAWVKVPALTSTDLAIVLHGGVARADSQTPATVWSASYESVYHLDENGGGTMAIDATTHGHVAQRTNGPLNDQSGAIGTAYSFDGANDILRITQSASFAGLSTVGTISTWINWVNPAANAYQRVMITSNRFSGDNLGFEWASQNGGGHYFYPRGPDADDVFNLAPQPYTAGVWQYAVVTLDFATKTVAMYVDGMPLTFTTTHVPTNWVTVGTVGNWEWGGDGAAPFAGKLDEIHIAHEARSANWILTEYRNQKTPGQFYAAAPAADE